MTSVRCIICGNMNYRRFYGKINNHQMLECCACGMIIAVPVDGSTDETFTDYGDYLILEASQRERRVQDTLKTMMPIFRKISQKFENPTILDMGCGGGYLFKAAERAGLAVYGVEPSDKLREYCEKSMHIKNVYKSIYSIPSKFDVVIMNDVIEHLNPAISRETMECVVKVLNKDGMLIGNTPNIRSLNIRLAGVKDPVIAPPSHTCYFSPSTIHRYLTSLGLEKLQLCTEGFSTNAFLRPSKFEKSFVEAPFRQCRAPLALPYILVKVGSAVLGRILGRMGAGYQIRFTYRRP